MGSEKKSTFTPMMQQYYDIKAKLDSETLLLFRLGDFYEMFHEDAEIGAKLLGITLTKRNGTPMAGIPYHAAENYINKALKTGKKIAICEQTETPQPGKLVQRELTRILSPGTILEDSRLDEKSNHYILALDYDKSGYHASWLDISTGSFYITTDTNPNALTAILNTLSPKEIIISEKYADNWKNISNTESWDQHFNTLKETSAISTVPHYAFEKKQGYAHIIQCLSTQNLEGFGIADNHPALGTAGALIYYCTENLCGTPKNLNKIKEYTSQDTLLLDPATLRNLEIFKSIHGTRDNSLINAMDATVTAAGGRLLEEFLASPLVDTKEIQRRNHCVASLQTPVTALNGLREALKNTRDIVRILGRLQNKIRNPRELGAIRDTLAEIPHVKNLISDFSTPHLDTINNRIHPLEDLKKLLCDSLEDNLPNNLIDGGFIKPSYNEELNRLKSLTKDQKTWLSDLEAAEQKSTGIRNLKIKFNNSFGYFIEITKANTHLAPNHYIRKQTMTNAERYYTPELKEKEKEILHAEEKAITLEQQLFLELAQSVINQSHSLIETAYAIAEVDVLSGWAHIARTYNYCCPTVDNQGKLYIEEGRHPVVEQKMSQQTSNPFIPNTAELDSSTQQIALITGPNMAGKSTFIRQVALITLMAQVGSWVPAKQCHIGIVDRIFSRVGASDDLARGSSTFMVEMNETANILNNTTPKSLIILDEIGRGTSTYDGLSIAWAVIENIHGKHTTGPKTLFATHYHELTQLEEHLPRLKNFTVSVKEWNDSIIFTRQLIEGAADRSYGIHVARLAGLPKSVINRAEIILEKLENQALALQYPDHKSREIFKKPPQLCNINQLELFCTEEV